MAVLEVSRHSRTCVGFVFSHEPGSARSRCEGDQKESASVASVERILPELRVREHECVGNVFSVPHTRCAISAFYREN